MCRDQISSMSPLTRAFTTGECCKPGTPCSARAMPGALLANGCGMAIEDLLYPNAIIYCLDVEKYMEPNGDGVGDCEGLSARLEYLAGLGVTCVWLLPFFESPNRDNGYDVTDYCGVHQKHGSLGDF